jgi:hypothetical protein
MFVLFWALPSLDKLCLHSEKKAEAGKNRK